MDIVGIFTAALVVGVIGVAIGVLLGIAGSVFAVTIDEKEIQKRRDLRDEIIFTIDGDDAKDFDDAVGIKELENGNKIVSCLLSMFAYIFSLKEF